jgi:SAM-dependent methyltransferase
MTNRTTAMAYEVEREHPATVLDIQQFFRYGLDREIQQLWIPPDGEHLNLGPGKRKVIPGATGLGLEVDGTFTHEYWEARWSAIPRGDGTVAAIHAYQFLEHFDGETAVNLIRDFERVLMPKGCVYIAVPYYKSQLAYDPLDHKSRWTEEVWHWLFDNEYYDDHQGAGWQLYPHICLIIGLKERNLNLFTQLVKRDVDSEAPRPGGV